MKTPDQDSIRFAVDSCLRNLTYREREIIKLRYGLGDGYTYTLEEVGRIFKITREKVRRIEKQAVQKLEQDREAFNLLAKITKDKPVPDS